MKGARNSLLTMEINDRNNTIAELENKLKNFEGADSK